MQQDDDVEITAKEARRTVEAHEKQHGRDMSDRILPGSKWGRTDNPSQRDLDEPPDWFKQGKKRGELPEE